MKAVNLAPKITFEKTSNLEIKKETSRAKEDDLNLYNNRPVSEAKGFSIDHEM